MRLLGDDAENVAKGPITAHGGGEKPWSVGKGRFSVFYALKCEVGPLGPLRETMPGGSPDIRPNGPRDNTR